MRHSGLTKATIPALFQKPEKYWRVPPSGSVQFIVHVIVFPVGRVIGEHEVELLVGARLVKVNPTPFDAADTPPCPSEAVVVAVSPPGVLRL